LIIILVVFIGKMSPTNNYTCDCMNCGKIIKRLEGESAIEQKNWYENSDFSIKLCEICELLEEDQDYYDVDEEDDEEDIFCACCGTTCLDHTSNKGNGSEYPCEICNEHRCKYCPCECDMYLE